MKGLSTVNVVNSLWNQEPVDPTRVAIVLPLRSRAVLISLLAIPT